LYAENDEIIADNDTIPNELYADWKEDFNENGDPDENEYISLTFKAGEHGKIGEGVEYVTEKIYLP
jgi:hypothetical protein